MVVGWRDMSNIGWAVIVANHALLATLPLGAYGFGVHLHSRVGLIAQATISSKRRWQGIA